MHFADGGKYCSRSHFHEDGKPYYEKGDGIDAILEMDINGDINYTASQWQELADQGKLDNPAVRAIGFAGLKNKVKWLVANEEELAQLQKEVELDKEYFNGLRCRNLVDRHITADIAAFYNVRVGMNEEDKVARHYYPRYDHEMNWVSAKCRTLPKEFSFDHLGNMSETKLKMFGQYTLNRILKEGGRMNKLLLVGGECDAMAGQKMLYDAATGQYKGKYYHVWAPNNGEKAMEDILENAETIRQFDEIIVAFDNDETGTEMNRAIAKLFRGKVKYLVYPDGCKDANDCLKKGLEKEFVNAWFNPVDAANYSTMIKSAGDLADKAKAKVKMGLSWFNPKLNAITLGIRKYMLITIGAGSGVGKTHFTKEVCFHLIQKHNEPVGVIYLEEPAEKTLRSYAGRSINKRIELPAYNPEDPDDIYDVTRDYTEEAKNKAVDAMVESNMLFIADTGGDKSLETVMRCIDDFMAMGITNVVLDNLTAITLPSGNKVEALDTAMKELGTYKDAHPITLFLISHLKKVGGEGSPRKPHTLGGEVYESDFRGSGSIVFWSNYVLAIERNTMASNDLEKRITTVRCVKDRDQGLKTNETVTLYGDPETGKLIPYEGGSPKSKKFDTGTDEESNPQSEY
jgi:twinkle protein